MKLTNKQFMWGILIGYLVGSFFGISAVFGSVGAKKA